MEKVIEAEMIPLLCIGESEAEKKRGETKTVLKSQIDAALGCLRKLPDTLWVAYEPIWAIGTGKTPSAEEVEELHLFIDSVFERYQKQGVATRYLYGGSVSVENVAEFAKMPHINGALVGGASLRASSFIELLQHTF